MRGLNRLHQFDKVEIVRIEKPEKFYVSAGFESFRVWYDGSGGYFRPTGTEFTLFGEDLSLTRSKAWLELGVPRDVLRRAGILS